MRLGLEARLSIQALLESQQGNLFTLRLCGRMLDKVQLSSDEKQSIGYQVISHPAGAKVPAWNASTTLPEKEIEFDQDEREKLKSILEGCTLFTMADRVWLEPLMEQLQ